MEQEGSKGGKGSAGGDCQQGKGRWEWEGEKMRKERKGDKNEEGREWE